MSWVYLALAIVLEIGATMALRASDGLRDKRWLPVVMGGYVLSFGSLSLSLHEGMPIGVAYGIWSAVGIAATAVIARFAFNDPLTRTMGLGIMLVVGGVLLVEIGSH